jgi:hypothetical protein
MGLLYWFGLAPHSSVVLLVVLFGVCYNGCHASSQVQMFPPLLNIVLDTRYNARHTRYRCHASSQVDMSRQAFGAQHMHDVLSYSHAELLSGARSSKSFQ